MPKPKASPKLTKRLSEKTVFSYLPLFAVDLIPFSPSLFSSPAFPIAEKRFNEMRPLLQEFEQIEKEEEKKKEDKKKPNKGKARS
jgi:hypothetical protein